MENHPTGQPADISPTDKFFRYFQIEVTELQNQMQRLQDHASLGGERIDAIEHCLARIGHLSSEVQAASSFLPAHDQRTYSEAIKALSNKLQAVRNSFAPRPKFSFKTTPTFSIKKNASAISLQDAAELASERRRQVPGYMSSEQSSVTSTPVVARTPNPDGAAESFPEIKVENKEHNALIVSDKADVRIDMSDVKHDAAHAGTFININRSVVDMHTSDSQTSTFATLTLKNVSSSLIICGSVSGSAHLTNVQNSVIVVASRQFRMHSSHDCDVYLHTSSRPIIEDCSQIRFAPIPALYSPSKDDNQNSDQWRNVDDFKWLRNEPSPNWTILKPVLDEGAWQNISQGKGRMSVSEMLQSVNIT